MQINPVETSKVLITVSNSFLQGWAFGYGRVRRRRWYSRNPQYWINIEFRRQEDYQQQAVAPAYGFNDAFTPAALDAPPAYTSANKD